MEFDFSCFFHGFGHFCLLDGRMFRGQIGRNVFVKEHLIRQGLSTWTRTANCGDCVRSNVGEGRKRLPKLRLKITTTAIHVFFLFLFMVV